MFVSVGREGLSRGTVTIQLGMASSVAGDEAWGTEFIEEFSLADAVQVTPVKETPWCGEGIAVDTREFTRKGWGPQSVSLNKSNRVSLAFSRDYEAARREDQSYLRILEVETPEYDAYVFEFPDVHRSRAAITWFSDVVSSYKTAAYLGASVQPKVIGDGWWAIKKVESQRVERPRKVVRENDGIGDVGLDDLRENLVHDAIRLTIAGHPTFHNNRLVFQEDGTYTAGSFECSGQVINGHVYRFIRAAKQSVRIASAKPKPVRMYQIGLRKYARVLEESAALDWCDSPVIESNLTDIQHLFPIEGMGVSWWDRYEDDIEAATIMDTLRPFETVDKLDQRTAEYRR